MDKISLKYHISSMKKQYHQNIYTFTYLSIRSISKIQPPKYKYIHIPIYEVYIKTSTLIPLYGM